jgi:hypothetical protein
VSVFLETAAKSPRAPTAVAYRAGSTGSIRARVAGLDSARSSQVQIEPVKKNNPIRENFA